MSPPFFLKSVSLLLKKDLSELNAYEIAEKLSFMVYGSIPDDELLLSAKNKTIFEPSVRKAHFIRLIEKYKDRFIHLFLGQFFEFRRMKDSTELNALFYKESLLVLKDLFLSDAPVTQYLSPGFTYLNKKLADHYKVDGDFNEEFKKINILERGSVLTQGSFLSLTGVVMNENPPLGQPIKRGLWVQSRLLCNPVGVASAELRTEIERVKGTLNPTDPLYKKLELHRNSGASCLNCHQYIDPVGISLEKYDHLGKKRDYYDEYNGTNTIPVVTKGELIGKNFEGVSELSKLLSDLSEFRRCMAERTSVYALGINTTSKDSAFIKTLSQNTTNGKAPSFKELLLKIIESKNFILTRSEKELSK